LRFYGPVHPTGGDSRASYLSGDDIKAVQEALGHADIGSTMGYTELANDRLAQAIQTLSWGET